MRDRACCPYGRQVPAGGSRAKAAGSVEQGGQMRAAAEEQKITRHCNMWAATRLGMGGCMYTKHDARSTLGATFFGRFVSTTR